MYAFYTSVPHRIAVDALIYVNMGKIVAIFIQIMAIISKYFFYFWWIQIVSLALLGYLYHIYFAQVLSGAGDRLARYYCEWWILLKLKLKLNSWWYVWTILYFL